jgi:hypothetical protein
MGQGEGVLRRWIRQVGLVTIGQVAWRHRGSLVRTADLVRHVPQRVRCRETDDLVTEAKAVLALDQAVPADTAVRITGIADGAVTLAGRADPAELQRARSALLRVPKVVDVQTDAGVQPSTDELLAHAVP